MFFMTRNSYAFQILSLPYPDLKPFSHLVKAPFMALCGPKYSYKINYQTASHSFLGLTGPQAFQRADSRVAAVRGGKALHIYIAPVI